MIFRKRTPEEQGGPVFFGIWLALVLFIFLVIMPWALSVKFARAHHWYDADCCSGRDCFAVEDGEIVPLPDNEYLVVRSGEVFGHPDSTLRQRRARWSKDSRFHRCTIDGTRDARESICIYVPPPSF